MVKTSIALFKPHDQGRSEAPSQPHLDTTLIERSVHVTVAHEKHGDLVLVEECKGRLRITNRTWPIFVHCMSSHGVVGKRFVHTDQNDFACSAGGRQILLQPSQLTGSKPFAS